MPNILNDLGESASRGLMVKAAKRAAEAARYSLNRVPGRGLSNVWNVEKEGMTLKAAIRTTRDRSIAFPPLASGSRWKTLSDVDLVIVAAVNVKDDPSKIEVYFFPALEVRKRFDAAYAARTQAGQLHKDNFGMWVPMDHDQRGIASSIGSGIAGKFKPVAVYTIESLLDTSDDHADTESGGPAVDAEDTELEAAEPLRLSTIGEVMAFARVKIADLAGVRLEAVKLDLKLEV